MATFYSDLYGTPPNADAATAPVYKGPHGHMSAGGVYVVRGVLTIASAFGAGDLAKLLVAPERARLLRFVAVPSGDLDAANTFTFNLGWNIAGSNTHTNGSNGLQGSAAFALSAADLASSLAAAAKGDELVLTRAAGSLSAGSITFIAELMQG